MAVKFCFAVLMKPRLGIIRDCFCAAARHAPAEMSQEETASETNQPAPPRVPGGGRRRGHRGGRGRRRPAPSVPAAEQPAPAESLPPPAASSVSPPELPARPAPPRQKFQPAVPAPRAAEPDGSAISRAVSEVTQVVESLKEALNQMEEALELVELAERQKIADEREIDSLRRLLRQLQQPRDGRGERRGHGVGDEGSEQR
jgi:hypothetical protein